MSFPPPHRNQPPSDSVGLMTEHGEAAPLAARVHHTKRSEFLFYLFLPAVVITLSTSLIRINQMLMAKEHFPYPFVLVILHCYFCTLFALILLWLRPGLFPALRDPDKKVELSLRTCCCLPDLPGCYITSILPIALCFTVSLVLSNLAYKYCTVAFLQMIKEGNIMVIFAMTYAFGIETFEWTKLGILLVMLFATWSCVDGELNFNIAGFLVQVTAGVCEATKTILQSLLLAGKGFKLDPMSMVLTLMPMCGLLLSGVLIFHILLLPLNFVKLPSWDEVWVWRVLLAASICNAFVLNVAIAVFLKYLSPVVYVLTGNIKDIVVVCMSAFLIGEPISSLQILGFSTQVLCVFAWTSYKHNGQLVPKELLLEAFEAEKNPESIEALK